MAILPINLASVPDLLKSSVASQQLDNTQEQLLQVENQLSSGQQLSTASDNPAAAALIEQLNRNLNSSQTYSANINAATSQLGVTDTSLGTLTGLLEQAQQIASANVGSTASDSQRQSAAAVVQSIYSQALSIANQQFGGQYIFGGAAGQQQPFVETNGGVQFMGTVSPLTNIVDAATILPVQASGANVFGAYSSEVKGTVDLSPSLSDSTRVMDLSGANGTAVTLSSIQISDGTVSKIVDLSGDQSIGDIINSINQAGVGDLTASISGQGLTISGGATDNITIKDVAGGTTAASLGIATAATGAGNSVLGASVGAKVTALTPLTDLRDGQGIDDTGLTITNGLITKTITWPANGNVQDMLNAINGAGLGVSAQINSTGTGINILNATQGVNMSISEAGGTTAADLGVRSFDPSTPLSQLNNGAGVQTAGGTTPDFQITRADGTTFTVSVSSCQTVQDVINSINAADGGNGVTASFATTGNGIVLTDTTGGAGTLTVTPLNNSAAATDLGLNATAQGNVITGSDVNQAQSGGIFADLQGLITGLETNNQAAITKVGSSIQNDTNQVIGIRGQVGAMEQQMTQRQTTLTEENSATQTLLSQLQDTNYTDTITKYQQLQTALQAGLETTAQSMQLSLLDYLS